MLSSAALLALLACNTEAPSVGGAPDAAMHVEPASTGGVSGSGGAPGSGGIGSGGSLGSGGTPAPDASVDLAASDTGAGERGPVVMDPGTEGDGVSSIAAPFHISPESIPPVGGPKGKVILFNLNGADSKVYPRAYTREAALYLPPGYVSGTEIPFMTAQDAIRPMDAGRFTRLVTLVDNMIPSGRVPPMAIIGSNPTDQRSAEYDTVSDAFTRFVETELLPEAKRQAKMMANVDLNLTADPEGRGSFGGSSGGVCAFTMGWFGNFHRILTVSPSFAPLQRSTQYPMGAAEYQRHLIADSPTKPLRVFLEAGSMDAGPVNGGTSWKVANDQVAAVLAKKGYHYKYIMAEGATHSDPAAQDQYLPEALAWLWRGYPIRK